MEVEKKITIEKNMRQSNFEVLRIISMLMIVLSHIIFHGLKEYASFDTDFNTLLVRGIEFIGRLGNFLFLYISGYFLIYSVFSWKKVLNLWIKMFLYSVLIGGILFVLKIKCLPASDSVNPFLLTTLNSKHLIKSFFPFITNANWFISCYLIFYILSPFLNKMVLALDKKDHILLCCICVLFVLFLPMIPNLGIISLYNSRLFVFITVYLISSYIRLYDIKLFNHAWKYFLCAIVLFFILIAYRIFICFVVHSGKITFSLFVNKPTAFLNVFTGMNSLPLFLLATLIFLGFKNIEIKNNNFINIIASTSLGIYLFHENRYIRFFLWYGIFKLPKYFYSKKLPLILLGTTVVVFLFGVVLDLCISWIQKSFTNLFSKVLKERRCRE